MMATHDAGLSDPLSQVAAASRRGVVRSDSDQARRQLGVASGGEGVMIRLALAFWLDEEFLISDVLRLDHVNRSAVRAALEQLLS